MKKTAITVLAAVLMLGLAVAARPDEGSRGNIVLKIGDPYMLVNGVRQQVDPGRSTKPVIVANRTLVPIRAIVENMGGTVEWIPARQEVRAAVYDKVVTLTIGSQQAYIETIPLSPAPGSANGGRKLEMLDVPAQTLNGRTMVPARFVTSSLGATVDWNSRQQTVTITFHGYAGNKPVSPPAQGSASAPSQGTAPNQGTAPDQGNTAPANGTKPPSHDNPHTNLAIDPATLADCAKCHPNH